MNEDAGEQAERCVVNVEMALRILRGVIFQPWLQRMISHLSWIQSSATSLTQSGSQGSSDSLGRLEKLGSPSRIML
jgi:hypothetical protein